MITLTVLHTDAVRPNEQCVVVCVLGTASFTSSNPKYTLAVTRPTPRHTLDDDICRRVQRCDVSVASCDLGGVSDVGGMINIFVCKIGKYRGTYFSTRRGS